MSSDITLSPISPAEAVLPDEAIPVEDRNFRVIAGNFKNDGVKEFEFIGFFLGLDQALQEVATKTSYAFSYIEYKNVHIIVVPHRGPVPERKISAQVTHISIPRQEDADLSFKTLLRNQLMAEGLSETQADLILGQAVQSETLANMKGRWNDAVGGYFDKFPAIIYALIRPIAFDWIKHNAPHAWFAPIFSPEIGGLQTKDEIEVIMSQFASKYPWSVYVPEQTEA